MDAIHNLTKILVSSLWQENLNIWKFHENVFTIKKYSTPNFILFVEYSVEKRFDGKFLLKTKNANFGDLVLTLNYENSLPRIILQSLQKREIYFELQASNTVSTDQKFIIENRIIELRKNFELKKDEIAGRILHFRKTSRPDKQILIKDCESDLYKLDKIERKIEMLEKVIYSTINVTTNFDAYKQNIMTDITKLQEEITGIS